MLRNPAYRGFTSSRLSREVFHDAPRVEERCYPDNEARADHFKRGEFLLVEWLRQKRDEVLRGIVRDVAKRIRRDDVGEFVA